MIKIDTSAEAVERLAHDLEGMTLFMSYDDALSMQNVGAATLRALAAERDAAREMCRAASATALDYQAERDAARAEMARLREAPANARTLLNALCRPTDALAQAVLDQCDAALAQEPAP